MKHDYCVIGLGRFGSATVEELIAYKKKVLVIDEDKEKINNIADKVNYAISLDSTNSQALESVGISGIQNVIVAISGDIETSVLTCVVLKDMGVPNIVAKASSNSHEKILRSIGITNIIRPEAEAGRQAAIRSIYNIDFKIIQIGKEHCIASGILLNKDLIGKELSKLQLRNNNKFNIAVIKRNKEEFFPNKNFILQRGDEITFLSKNKDVQEQYNFITVGSTKEMKKISNISKKYNK